jgi:AcrR family transcriptional regulator/DNA-binding MarR family transcriptional regulator
VARRSPVSYSSSRSSAPRSPRQARDRAQVVTLQSARLTAATIAAVEADGYSRLTVAKIITSAKVSRRTFYEIFDGTEHCFLAALDQVLQRAGEIALAAYSSEQDWVSAMRAAMRAVFAAIEHDRGLARLCIVDALAAGPAIQARRAAALEQLAETIDWGARGAQPGREPEPLVARAIAGGIASVLHTRLLEGEEPLMDLVGPLMSLVVMPYRGLAAARKELRARPPRPSGKRYATALEPAVNPLEGLQMRLTYRTIRVLVAIAEKPGAMNAEVADRAEIADQGQISKLMQRLERLDLVENRGEGQAKGASNAWYLTDLGETVWRATRGH